MGLVLHLLLRIQVIMVIIGPCIGWIYGLVIAHLAIRRMLTGKQLMIMEEAQLLMMRLTQIFRNVKQADWPAFFWLLR